MKVAVCGYPPLAQELQDNLKADLEFKFFVSDLVSDAGKSKTEFVVDLPLITFFEFRRLVDAGELDGIVVIEVANSNFAKEVVRLCKLYEIEKVGVVDLSRYKPQNPIYWLDAFKIFLPYIEADITDSCNLKCRACFHFANFSCAKDFYPTEIFRRDVRQLARNCDVLHFRLLGGEPFLMKNFDEYLNVLRQNLPRSDLGVVTNGLLIPSLDKKIFEALRKNKCFVYISAYPPTLNIIDKIQAVLESNEICFDVGAPTHWFRVFLTGHAGNDTRRAREYCCNDICRSLYRGKIYKCPPDAFHFKLKEKFGENILPAATGVDIYSQNLSSLLQMLDGDVEMCRWCSDHPRKIPWEVIGSPKLEDWLADPDELNAF